MADITELPEEISNDDADIESVDDNVDDYKHLLKKQETIKPKRVLSEKQKEGEEKGRGKREERENERKGGKGRVGEKRE